MEGNKKIISRMHTNKNITYAFPVPSVSATIDGLFMFVSSESSVTSLLHKYAKDRYIMDVIELLRSMGARIEMT